MIADFPIHRHIPVELAEVLAHVDREYPPPYCAERREHVLAVLQLALRDAHQIVENLLTGDSMFDAEIVLDRARDALIHAQLVANGQRKTLIKRPRKPRRKLAIVVNINDGSSKP